MMNEPDEVQVAVDDPGTCPNCEAPLDGVYCKECGQKDVQLRSARAYVGDAWSDLVGLDSRVVRTLRLLLFSPGRLTTEYWAGRRTHYVTPIRLYLSVTFLAFTLSFFAGRSVEDGGAAGDTWINVGLVSPDSIPEPENSWGHVELWAGDRQSTSRSPSESVAADGQAAPGGVEGVPLVPVADAEMESLFAYLDHGDVDGYGDMKERLGLGDEVDEAVTRAWMTRLESGDNGAMTILLNRMISEVESDPEYGADSVLGRLAIGFMRGLLGVDGLGGIEALLRSNFHAYMPRALFLAMPLMALLLKLVFIRRRRLFVEHLVFSVHSYATLFVALSITSCFSILTGTGMKWIEAAILLYFMGLIIAGLKRVYGQSWIRGILTGTFVLGVQGVVLLLLALVTVVAPVVQDGWS